MREPEEFDATKRRLAKQWFTKAFYWATTQLPNHNNSEETMLMWLLTLMKPGKAADWAQPQLEKMMGHKHNCLTSLAIFTTVFKNTFRDPNAAHVAARQIEALKQDGLVVDYTTAFENFWLDLEWNEPTYIAQYERGLQHRVKSQLAFLTPYQPTLEELQAAAIRIHNLHTELDAPRPPKNSHTLDTKGEGHDCSNATSTTAQVKLSLPNDVKKEERNSRRAEGLFIRCGAPDHAMKQCRNTYLINRLSASKDASPAKKKEEPKKESVKVAQLANKEEEMESEGSGNE